jgi:hypothetical protein
MLDVWREDHRIQLRRDPLFGERKRVGKEERVKTRKVQILTVAYFTTQPLRPSFQFP